MYDDNRRRATRHSSVAAKSFDGIQRAIVLGRIELQYSITVTTIPVVIVFMSVMVDYSLTKGTN
jgi:hypothetical protein